MGDPMKDDPMKYLAIDNAQRLKEQAKPFDGKKQCWIPTAKSATEGYVEGEIKGTKGELILVEYKGETKEYKKEQVDQMNPPKYEKCSDMSNLTFLNEASVLYNLTARYAHGLIYTYSGLFCIAVNPYRRLPIYLDEVVTLYRGKRRPEMPPHVFAIVDNAYQDMLIDHEHQSMLITGESGAGKTENTKKVIQYIAKVAGVEKGGKDAPPPPEPGVTRIKGTLDEQVVEANPLLEAFGNAKTTRNNNSSRFGKFIRCHFSQTGKLAGADIESYLLEKNRVTHQGTKERNYHIFYQILYASTDDELAGLCLLSREAPNYGFLSKGVAHVDKMDDHEEFGYTTAAIKVLGFTEEEGVAMFKIVASVLNFSCMKFKQKPRDEQAEVVDPSDGERVAYLMGLPVGEFHKSLCKPKVKVGTEFVNKGQTVDQVLYAIGALSKAVFERLFWWIVERVNKALDTKQRRSYYIGVLDIAGFEIFDYNSFDQLCINFTNEKLQQFFNHHMFVLEQEEYKKEGIVWEFIDFGMDLEETINLIEKPSGIFAMLEEECIVPKATDTTYLNKLHKAHAGKSKAYQKPTPKQTKQGGGDFILHHYAGSVGYSVAGWLEKNKDPINENTAQLFSKGSNALVAHLFLDYDPDKAGKRKGSAFQTVSFRHKEQLRGLMGTLMSTSPHFVRCIIPNENKAPGEIDGQLVLHQLRCNGVLEGIRICRKGFPSRMLFTDFRQRYQILSASSIPEGFIDGKVAAEKLIGALQLDESEFRIGLTKVFFKAGIVGELEEMRDERLSKIISQFQAYCKAHLMRIEYKKMKDQVIGLGVIQRNVRKFLYIRNWPWWKLYLLVQPLLSIARTEDEMKEKEEELKKAMENAVANESKRVELESQMTDVMAEKEKLFADLQGETERLLEAEEKLLSVQTEKEQLEASLNETMERLEGEEHGSKIFQERYNKSQKEIEDLSNKGDELRENISKLEGEKSSRDKQIDALNEDILRQEEAIAKLNKDKNGVADNLTDRTEQLQATEDKLNKMNKEKNKVEATLKETEFSLGKEKEGKAKVEKEKRKVEVDLKETKEKLSQTEEDLKVSKDTVVKKEKAIRELEEVKESNENTIKQLQKKVAELLGRIEELEEELETEKKNKNKVELARKDLESQLEALNEELVVSGDATSAQVEVAKKKESEIGRMRQEMEDALAAQEDALVSTKNKHNAALAEVQDEIENLQKAKSKSDKDKGTVAGELADVQGQLETLKKQKAGADKNNRGLEEQLNELKGKLEEVLTSLTDTEAKAVKAAADGANVGKVLEETEHKLGLSRKEAKALDAALQEAKGEAEGEAKARHDTNLKLKGAQSEIEALNEQLEEEAAAKAALQAKLSKALTEGGTGKGSLSEEDVARLQELEDVKRKLTNFVQELEEGLAAAETKAAGVEKAKHRLSEEMDDLSMELEKVQAQASSAEKRSKKFDAQIGEWRLKCGELQSEVDKAQKEARSAAAEALKQRNNGADLEQSLEAAKKECRSLAAEIKSMSEQLSDGGKSNVEVEKIQRKLGLENEELQLALEETELALEQEESKLVKLTLEATQLKQAASKAAGDKEAELETSRRNHQRQLEALQATVEAELRTKGDMQKDRKALEGHALKLESALEAATRNTGEYQKTIKKLQVQIRDLQGAVDDEVHVRDEARDAAIRAERRANELAVAVDEVRVGLEQSERARKLAETQMQDNVDRLGEIQGLYTTVSEGKRKAENDYYALTEEIENLEDDIKAAEDKVGKAVAEVGRMTVDLTNAQEAASTSDQSRQLLASQISELQGQLEDAEASGGRGLKNQIRKLELRIMELESDMDSERRKSIEVAKQSRRSDKRVKEVEQALDEERKASIGTKDVAEKLNAKVKTMRFQLEESQMQNSGIQTKYRKSVAELEEAENRCEAAEIALQKARQKAKSASPSAAGTRGVSAAGSRQRSRMRTPVAED